MQYLNFKTMKVFKVAINYIITTKALKIMNKFISWFHDDSKKKISKICWYKFYCQQVQNVHGGQPNKQDLKTALTIFMSPVLSYLTSLQHMATQLF